MISSMTQKIRLFILPILSIFLFSSLYSLSAISFIPNSAPFDPNNFALLLEKEDFFQENIFSGDKDGGRYTISLSTMGRGDPLYVWFGHTALVITDNSTKQSVMYDYGIFSFDEGFYTTFALGRLWYESWATDTQMRFRLAKEEHRDISLVHLDLPDDVALHILNFVNKSVKPEFSTYLYHHYRENCSTRIRDIINEATGGEFKNWANSIQSDYTIRELVSFHTASNPFIHFTLNFLQSKSIDKPITLWDEMFLPERLEEALLMFDKASMKKIVTEREIIHEAPHGIRPENNQSKERATLCMSLFSTALALLLFFLRRGMRNTIYKGLFRWYKSLYSIISISWTLIAALFSSVLLFMMVVSNHDVTYFNENILIISPLSVLMLISIIHQSFSKEPTYHLFEALNTISIALIGFLLIAKGLFPEILYQNNYDIMVTLLPLYIGNSTLVRKLLKKKTRVISNKTW